MNGIVKEVVDISLVLEASVEKVERLREEEVVVVEFVARRVIDCNGTLSKKKKAGVYVVRDIC